MVIMYFLIGNLFYIRFEFADQRLETNLPFLMIVTKFVEFFVRKIDGKLEKSNFRWIFFDNFDGF
jgi:hypothetical protein